MYIYHKSHGLECGFGPFSILQNLSFLRLGFPLKWSFQGDWCSLKWSFQGLLNSLYNWVVFHPLYTRSTTRVAAFFIAQLSHWSVMGSHHYPNSFCRFSTSQMTKKNTGWRPCYSEKVCTDDVFVEFLGGKTLGSQSHRIHRINVLTYMKTIKNQLSAGNKYPTRMSMVHSKWIISPL